jgi:DNA repair ATPase RecN
VRANSLNHSTSLHAAYPVHRDFVIVDTIELEFSAGFTVFTGETGAGKSILIDALTLALGGRGDASVVREGAAKADITADFAVSEQARAWLVATNSRWKRAARCCAA